MRILNGNVYTGGAFVRSHIEVEDGRFASVEPAESQLEAAAQDLDASGCFVVPGLIDLHFHGCVGHDFCDASPEGLSAIASWQAAHGITAMCPATMTYPEETLAAIMDVAASFAPDAGQAALVGINMEGPFISPNKVGAQNPAYVQACDVDMFRRLQERSGGLVKLVDVAPEEPGALDFIAELASEVRISLAHTCADYDTALEAFRLGAAQLTHTCNAMPLFHHRDPGPIGAALESGHVLAELIADGVHVHPSMVRSLFALFGVDRIVLVSDSMEACGLEDGTYALGGQAVSVRGKRATLADGTIAGSTSDLLSCVQVAVGQMGIDLASAIQAASLNPARALGIDGDRGSIEAGKIADALVLDGNLKLVNVVLRGVLQE